MYSLVRTRIIGLAVLLTMFPSLLAAASREERQPEASSLRDFDWVEGLRIDFPAVQSKSRQPHQPAPVEVRFAAWGRTFEMDLHPARLFADQARNIWLGDDGVRIEEAPENVFYSGRIKGEPDSEVRLAIRDQELEGLVLAGEDAYFLEPARRFFPGAEPQQTLAYRLDDVESLWADRQCAEQTSPELEAEVPLLDSPAGLSSAGAEFRALLDEVRLLAAPDASRVVEIRLVADSYYYSANGAASATRMQSVIHQINGIYERQAGLTFQITETRVWAGRSQDQVSATTDPDDLLDEFSTSEQVAGNDLVHLFTGRDLDGGVVGEARVAGICHASQATGLSQDLANAQLRTVLAAHEIGHNLGSRHDGQRSCSDVPSGFIMWPALSASASRFSDCSLGSFSRVLERAQCIAPLGGPPLAAPEALNPQGPIPDIHPIFEWQQVEGALSYRLQVYDESEDRLAIDAEVFQEAYRPDEPLQRHHSYRWRVGASDSRGAGEESPWSPFEIESLAAPRPVAPSGIIHTPRPLFSWQSVDGSMSYRVEIVDEDSDEAMLQELGEHEFQPSKALAGRRYRWRISAVDEMGTPSPSPWLRFTYRPDRPPSGPRDRP